MVNKRTFGVLRHKNFELRAGDLSFVESIHMVVTSTVWVFGFDNFVRILVFVGVGSNLKGKDFGSS